MGRRSRPGAGGGLGTRSGPLTLTSVQGDLGTLTNQRPFRSSLSASDARWCYHENTVRAGHLGNSPCQLNAGVNGPGRRRIGCGGVAVSRRTAPPLAGTVGHRGSDQRRRGPGAGGHCGGPADRVGVPRFRGRSWFRCRRVRHPTGAHHRPAGRRRRSDPGCPARLRPGDVYVRARHCRSGPGGRGGLT
jgi:hypothetical protein